MAEPDEHSSAGIASGIALHNRHIDVDLLILDTLPLSPLLWEITPLSLGGLPLCAYASAMALLLLCLGTG